MVIKPEAIWGDRGREGGHKNGKNGATSFMDGPYQIDDRHYFYEQNYMLKFIYSEKAKKLEEISNLVLTLLSNVKTKGVISSNFWDLLRKFQL